jgi:pyruvate/2-oxoglutarate dehydrogenase complex dihydrolipoamide acyltransferase (E2) component
VIVQVLMPQFGESVDEAYLTKWFKSSGEWVDEFESLIEVNTDKVDTEVPSPATGVLKEIFIPAGKVAKAGEVLAVIETDSALGGVSPNSSASTPGDLIFHDGKVANLSQESPSALGEFSFTQAKIDKLSRQPAYNSDDPGREKFPKNGSLGFISPVVAKIARQENIDLHLVKGTGLAGRITRRDIEVYLNQRDADQQAEHPENDGHILIPHTPIRRLIAEHMRFSKQTSPHVTTVMEADLSQVVAHRQANKQVFANQGANLTFTAYFLSATAAALRAYPIANSSWTEEGIVLHKGIHLGMATSLGEEGLIVPVIQDADTLSLIQMALTIHDLASRARLHQLKPEEVKGGTFTLTNHGISGSLFASPIINQPQCAILGVGVIQKRVVVISSEDGSDLIAIRPMVYLSLTFDHRILDGAKADEFLMKVVKSLENSN